MRVVLQRVKEARVEVQGKIVGKIDRGVCLLVGIERGDSAEDAQYLARKIAELRIFPDSAGKMNLSLTEVQGEVLAVSQFTIAGSVKKGRRPSFDNAEKPERSRQLFKDFMEKIREKGLRVETGIFAATMDVCLINDGPVTFIIDSRRSENKTLR